MNTFYINSIISLSLTTFFFPAVAVFVVLRNRAPNELNWTFAHFLISVAWWTFFNLLTVIASSKELGFLFNNLCLSGTVWIPSTFHHFVSVYTQSKYRNRFFIMANYAASSFFLITLWYTTWFVKDVSPRFGVNYWTDPGPLYLFFIIFFISCTIASIGNLWCFQKVTTNHETKRQALVLFWFLVIGYTGGSCNYLISYHIKIPVIAELSNYCVFFLGIGIAYIIFRYRFLEVEDVLAIHRDKLMLLGLMSSSLTHEIKNPLFLIKGYTDKISTLAGKKNDSEITESIHKLSGQVSRMSTLVTRLSDFGKPNPNPGMPEAIDVAQTLENALFFAEQELKHHNIELVKNIDSDLPRLKGDRSQFEEIFLNLIMNAFHSMKDGGTLTICAKSNSELRTPQSAIEVSIIDTGSGIPKDALKNIFKPFYSTKGKQGTGLGLHIVKTLVEQNGGKISVESEVGKGTKFCLLFFGVNK